MSVIFNRNDSPSHVFNISRLDFSDDLFSERLARPWFRLGAWTITPRRDEQDVEDVVSRQTLLRGSEEFASVFDRLEAIGNVLGEIGNPGGSIIETAERKDYRYSPFHQFEIPFTSTVGEPLVFLHSFTSGAKLLINPDLWMFFELEERTRGNGIWWDPRRGTDALVQRVIANGNLELVEIRADYLLRYLQARQKSLLVGHYRHLHLMDPSQTTIDAFVKGDVTLGSIAHGAKAILQNWGLRNDIAVTTPFLQRRLHLWFEIKPPEFNVDDPWSDQPSFDPYKFTLPTRGGPVAPARWKTQFWRTSAAKFEGEACDFMETVYFRQEVLTKYEGASGFEVEDNGSVTCHHYWGLVRSTRRIGNELLATAIGDFAEGVPLEEWTHWKTYSVEAPHPEIAKSIRQEQSVPEAVNCLVTALEILNAAFSTMAVSLQVPVLNCLWRGSLDSLAGRQLKWVYPATADDDEFLKRATLASTLFIEEIETALLRQLLYAVGNNLHMNDEDPPRSLGSRNLLQRLTLVALLIQQFRPSIDGIEMLVRQAEGKAKNEESDLQEELEASYKRVRDGFAPLAFLYELRTYGGLAHKPDKPRAGAAAGRLGLPEHNWHRTDYLHLLNLLTGSVHQISSHLENGAEVIV